jgi:anthranilate phosphoribosyltransferase
VNAAPAIVAAGLADGFVEAMAVAADSVDTGKAGRVLEAAIAFSSSVEPND